MTAAWLPASWGHREALAWLRLQFTDTHACLGEHSMHLPIFCSSRTAPVFITCSLNSAAYTIIF